MEELFDVLNEKGQYTGRVETRQKCHKEGLKDKFYYKKEVQIKECGQICGILQQEAMY